MTTAQQTSLPCPCFQAKTKKLQHGQACRHSLYGCAARLQGLTLNPIPKDKYLQVHVRGQEVLVPGLCAKHLLMQGPHLPARPRWFCWLHHGKIQYTGFMCMQHVSQGSQVWQRRQGWECNAGPFIWPDGCADCTSKQGQNPPVAVQARGGTQRCYEHASLQLSLSPPLACSPALHTATAAGGSM